MFWMKTQKASINKISLDNVIRIMDRFNLGRIERRRFYEWFDILYVLLEIRKRRNKIKHLRNTLMPKWKECISKIYNNNYYSAIIHLINIYSLLLMFWREVMEVYGVSNLEILPLWTSVATIVNIIYFIDMIFSFIEFGFWKSIVDIYTLIEVGWQILSTAAFLKILISADYFFSIKVYELIVLVRIIKLLKLLEEIEQWKIIVLTLRRLVSPFVTLFLVQMGIVYTYAVIGERIYGGEISMKIVRKLSDANFGREFLTMNFNGLLISISTLLYFFHLHGLKQSRFLLLLFLVWLLIRIHFHSLFLAISVFGELW